MNSVRPFVIAVGIILLGHQVVAQSPEISRYRAYALQSSIASVVTASGTRLTSVKTLHERPATIQTLEWRAPYVDSRSTTADPVREISFAFVDDALYQIVVNYDRERTSGLTDRDVIESLSGTYGVPVLASAKTRNTPPVGSFPDSVVLARWENPETMLTLMRGSYTPEFQLILTSKPLGTRARSAIQEAARLDAIEAPRRESDQRKKDAGDATAARDKTRLVNKAAFRP